MINDIIKTLLTTCIIICFVIFINNNTNDVVIEHKIKNVSKPNDIATYDNIDTNMNCQKVIKKNMKSDFKFYGTHVDENVIRDIVINRSRENGDQRKKFKNNEINDFHDSQLKFYDKLRYDSSNVVDVVDRIDMKRVEKSEIGESGMTIGEYYDSLLK